MGKCSGYRPVSESHLRQKVDIVLLCFQPWSSSFDCFPWSVWPNDHARTFVQECEDPCVVFEGLWMVTLTCLSIGVVWYMLAESPFLSLANLPPDAWHIVTEHDDRRRNWTGRRRRRRTVVNLRILRPVAYTNVGTVSIIDIAPLDSSVYYYNNKIHSPMGRVENKENN